MMRVGKAADRLARISPFTCACALACCLLVAAAPRGCASPSGSDGVYGGYVGSDAWIASMIRSAYAAGHAAWAVNRAAALKSGKWSEMALIIMFHGGNPFPGKRVPDLNIVGPKGRDLGAYPYASHSSRSECAYYLLTPKGVRYSLEWMYFLGGRETFAHFQIPPTAPARTALVVTYVPGNRSSRGRDAGRPEPCLLFSTSRGYEIPRSDHHFKPPTEGPGLEQPHSDGGFKPPSVGPGFAPPGAGG